MWPDAHVGVLYDEITVRLRDRLSFQMGHLRDADSWQRDSLASLILPVEQRAALSATVEGGYYETPRETTLDDLAVPLDISPSTFSYRLWQAEIRLAHCYVTDNKQNQWF